MEKIQEKALNVIYNGNHSTYEELLAISKSDSLKIRRIIALAIQSFKLKIRKDLNIYIILQFLIKIIMILLTTMQHIYQQSRLPGMD